MFPYKARNPVYGGARNLVEGKKPKPSPKVKAKNQAVRNNDLQNSATTSQLRLGSSLFLNDNADGIDPFSVGGNLQRSILLDMYVLRERFYSIQKCNGESRKKIPSNRSGDECASQSPHVHLGTSFGQFKTAFRETRFGAIHTRAVPPWVDRGEYVQLVYSCCFFLLESSIGKCSYGRQLVWEDAQQTPIVNRPRAMDAIFAAFCLYALHETNNLPEVVQSDLNNKTSQSCWEKSMKKSLSMIPIGNTEDVLFRRSFRSLIRIDRWNYLLLLQLRDLCTAKISECSVGELLSSSCAHNNGRQCHCGDARDAIHIIDKMINSDSFFDFCEYHGPNALEGLAGNPNFYSVHFQPEGNNLKSRPGKSQPSKVMTETQLLGARQTNPISNPRLELGKLRSALENHRSNIQSVVSKLKASRQPGVDLQPKQRELVETTLRGVLRLSPSYVGMMKVFQPENSEQSIEKEDPTRDATNFARGPPQPSHMSSVDALSFVFPDLFSEELRKGIQESLTDFHGVVSSVRYDLIKERRAQEKKVQIQRHLHVAPDLDFFDCIPNGSDTSNNNEARKSSDYSHERNHRSAANSFLEVGIEGHSSNSVSVTSEIEDDISLTTDAGKKALNALLSMVGERSAQRQKRSRSRRNVPPKLARKSPPDDGTIDFILSNESEFSSDDDGVSSTNEMQAQPAFAANTGVSMMDEESTVVSGAGKRALQSLLACAAAPGNTRHRKRARSTVDTVNKQHDATNSSGIGKKALETLLSTAAEQSLPKNKVKNNSPTENKTTQRSRRTKDEMMETMGIESEDLDGDTVISGAGKRALQSLLKQATRSSSPLTPRNKAQKKPQPGDPRSSPQIQKMASTVDKMGAPRDAQRVEEDALIDNETVSTKPEKQSPRGLRQVAERVTQSMANRQELKEGDGESDEIDHPDEDGTEMMPESVPGDTKSLDPSMATSSKFRDDDFSVATGAGANALNALLASVKKE